MPAVAPYSLVFVGIILTTSLAVLGQVNDPCVDKTASCIECVNTKNNIPAGTPGSMGNCIYLFVENAQCVANLTISEQTKVFATNNATCAAIPTPSPAPSNTTTTTPTPTPPPTTNATTTVPPTTSSTTTAPTTNGTTTTTPAPTTNGTTTTVPTTPTPSPAPTNGTTTPAPSNTTTTAAPAPQPRKGGFAWGEFIGGIVFASALASVAYLIWRFYKARLDRNYHTFSNPTF